MSEETITTTKHELEPCRVQLDIEVPASRVDQVYSQAVQRFKQEANIPGFRPGKAPDSLLERRFPKEIQNEAIQRLVNESLQKAIQEEDLTIQTRPEVADEENLEVQKGTSFCFSVSFDIAPDFELPEYKGLKIDKEKEQVSDEEIKEFLDGWLQQRAEYEKVDRPAQSGDVLKVSYEGQLTDGTDDTEEWSESQKQLLKAEDTWLALQEPELLNNSNFVSFPSGIADYSSYPLTTLYSSDCVKDNIR